MRLHKGGDAMIGRETRMLLRHYLEQGASKSALARQLGVSRDTIHRWVRDRELDRDLDATPVRYGPRRPVPTKLDAYKAIIETRLAAYPALSAVRLLAEIVRGNFAGSYTQLKAFVRQVRPTPPPEPVIRLETPPGRQAQVDFARFVFPGACATRCSSCSATRACSGAGFMCGRTWGR